MQRFNQKVSIQISYSSHTLQEEETDSLPKPLKKHILSWRIWTNSHARLCEQPWIYKYLSNCICYYNFSKITKSTQKWRGGVRERNREMNVEKDAERVKGGQRERETHTQGLNGIGRGSVVRKKWKGKTLLPHSQIDRRSVADTMSQPYIHP